ncbi:hypothetical protein BE04_33865 [Sorangium cellulosum]|uniref:Uncharacterized protein n=1 Tax=Sorangium cellulosum TaxID=56 RepID=A0A150PWV4_SORCE|nr:hypothetical protein BE04_33865 [Sorangium cellulosum]
MRPPLPLHLFSPRAQQFLLSAEHDDIARDRESVARRLAECHRPLFAAAIDFEHLYGGLSWGEDTLGIYYDEPMRDENDPLDLDGTMVPIGSEGVCGLFMNEAGEVITQPNVKSASIEKYIEQRALLSAAEAHRAYRVKVRPATGDVLAASLGLTVLSEATDAYQAYFALGGVLLRHYRQQEVYEARADLVLAPSLEHVAAILESAAHVVGSPRVSVHRVGATVVRLSADEESSIPPTGSWSAAPDAVRFECGDEDDHHDGTVWLIGAPGSRRIEQYQTTAEGRLLSWTTYEDGKATLRLPSGAPANS